MTRISVDDWEHPQCGSWVKAIDIEIGRGGAPLVVVAHSLGCLAFARWAGTTRKRIHGALLVAVPDPSGPCFPREAEGFAPDPYIKLPCKSIVVSSDDDPYGSAGYARSCAEAWGSTLVKIGSAGHINGADLGEWPLGSRLLKSLRAEAI
jgi:predicted alpha/beta hydrolase family esterase